MKVEKQCVVCEKPYFAANNKGKYCSSACRMVAWRKRNMKYAWQEDDLTRLEELQEVYRSLQSSYSYAMQKCKEYELKIGQLQAERKMLNELNNRLLEKSETYSS